MPARAAPSRDPAQARAGAQGTRSPRPLPSPPPASRGPRGAHPDALISVLSLTPPTPTAGARCALCARSVGRACLVTLGTALRTLGPRGGTEQVRVAAIPRRAHSARGAEGRGLLHIETNWTPRPFSVAQWWRAGGRC